MNTVLLIFGVACIIYCAIMYGTISGGEYPRKREVSKTYDIVKATISGILAIVLLVWALILETGFKWPW